MRGRLTRRVALMGTLLAVAVPLGGAAAYTTAPACQLAVSWADTRPDALPTTIESMAALPNTYQRVALSRLDRIDRIALLGMHLASFTQPIETLSPLQRTILSQLAEPLTTEQIAYLAEVERQLPNLYSAIESDGRIFRLHAQLKARADLLFDRSTYRIVLNRVGPLLETSHDAELTEQFNASARGKVESALFGIQAFFSSGRASASIDCHCEANGDCQPGKYCLQVSPPCSEVNTCFTMLMAKCVGRCHDGGAEEFVEPTSSSPADTVISLVPLPPAK